MITINPAVVREGLLDEPGLGLWPVDEAAGSLASYGPFPHLRVLPPGAGGDAHFFPRASMIRDGTIVAGRGINHIILLVRLSSG
jgi:hypothetical protein